MITIRKIVKDMIDTMSEKDIKKIFETLEIIMDIEEVFSFNKNFEQMGFLKRP